MRKQNIVKETITSASGDIHTVDYTNVYDFRGRIVKNEKSDTNNGVQITETIEYIYE